MKTQSSHGQFRQILHAGPALFFATAWLLCAIIQAGAAEPFLDKTDLFQGGKDGFALYRIPGVVVTVKGTVLAYCEARRDARSDWGEIEVHLRRSTDGGMTWEPARQIAHRGARIEGNPHKKSGGEHEQTVNNPVAVADRQSGAVHFLYCINYARCFYMRSDDDGATFSDPVEITPAFEPFRAKYDWKVIATGPGHGIQLKNGRLVVPVWLAYGKVGDHKPSAAGTIYSDDHGKSWHAGDVALPNESEISSPSETAVVQLADGRVMLNARSMSKASRRLVTVSADGATGWSKPRFDDALPEPICMGSIARLSETPASDRNRILFSNPHSLKLDADGKEIPGGRGERKNVSIKLSYDEGKTWPVNKTLEEGSSAYSDLAVLPGGTILCFYERRNLLTLARFNIEWLTDGKDSLALKPASATQPSSAAQKENADPALVAPAINTSPGPEYADNPATLHLLRKPRKSPVRICDDLSSGSPLVTKLNPLPNRVSRVSERFPSVWKRGKTICSLTPPVRYGGTRYGRAAPIRHDPPQRRTAPVRHGA
jgi:sialidase-1